MKVTILLNWDWEETQKNELDNRQIKKIVNEAKTMESDGVAQFAFLTGEVYRVTRELDSITIEANPKNPFVRVIKLD